MLSTLKTTSTTFEPSNRVCVSCTPCPIFNGVSCIWCFVGVSSNYIKRLDLEDIVRPQMAQFFEFERNWDEFYSIWSQADVQQQVLLDIQGSGVLDLRQNDCGWRPGDTLWQLSPRRYVADVLDRIVRADHDFIAEALTEQCPSHANEVYTERIDAAVAPGRIHAYILPEAASHLSRAMLAVARRMFPRVTWYHVVGDHYSTVVSASHRDAVVFDLWLWHLHRYGGGPPAAAYARPLWGGALVSSLAVGPPPLLMPPPTNPTGYQGGGLACQVSKPVDSKWGGKDILSSSPLHSEPAIHFANLHVTIGRCRPGSESVVQLKRNPLKNRRYDGVPTSECQKG